MKRHISSVLVIALFLAAAYALGGSGASTQTITSATLTVNVGPAHFMEIYNFTQVDGNGQRGAVVAGIFPTPAPTATPPVTISTVAGPGVALNPGGTLTDTATLSGGNSPTGTITFTLKDPTNALVDTENVTVSGDRDYPTPGFTPGVSAATGTYTWLATYNGDNNNAKVSDNGQNETEVVSATPTPTVAPTPTPTPTPTPIPTPTPTPIVGTILTATIIDSGRPQEPIKPIIIQGPAEITVDPVPGATLSITYRKFGEPTPSATATPTATVTSATTGSATSTTTGTVNSGTVTIMDATTLDEDTDLSTPTPTPEESADAPVLMATVTPTPTPVATPSVTPTPTPLP